MLELEWVLRSSLEFGKDDVLTTLSSLLSAAELTFESVRALETARKAGELPADTDTATLPAFFAMTIQGLAVQARNGAKPAMLKRLAELAIQAWPAP